VERSEKGSFKVSDLCDLLHVSKVTAFEISKIPELNRKVIVGKYRILKKDFWKWYDSQAKYKVYDEPYIPDDYYTTGDIAEMFHMTTEGAYQLVLRKKLRSDVSSRLVLVEKKVFHDWYVSQIRYQSDDPRLPKQWFEDTYDINEIKKILGIRANSTIYHLYKKEFFDLRKIGYELRIDKASFDRWFESQTQYPRKPKGGDR